MFSSTYSPVCLSFMRGTSSIPSPLMMSLCSTSVLTLISSISFLISSASLCFVSYCRFLGSAEPHQPWVGKELGTQNRGVYCWPLVPELKDRLCYDAHHLVEEVLSGESRVSPVGATRPRPAPLQPLHLLLRRYCVDIYRVDVKYRL